MYIVFEWFVFLLVCFDLSDFCCRFCFVREALSAKSLAAILSVTSKIERTPNSKEVLDENSFEVVITAVATGNESEIK